MNDDAYLGPSNMQQMMTADSTHVLRRPGIGLSEFAGSLTSALDMLCAIQDHGDDVGLQELTSMLRSSDTILEALQYLNNNNEVDRDDDTMRNHIGTLHDFFTDERSNAIELFSKVSICASRIFVGAFSAVQVATAFRNKEWWSKSIPAKYTKGEVTQKWMERPDDRRRLCKALTAIYQSQDEESAAWQGRGNDATTFFKKKFAKPQTCEDSSEEPDRKRKNKKTQKKKHSSSSSTEKPKKQRSNRNSSDSSTEVQVKQKSKKR